ncbi:MAG: bifunctional demethylmenaquinone methyltransferase/2-methoxy-6-polyprenyl-1,4-benzoquinol methylase UbiE [Geitlerinemataceae cyanobacterium]
MEAGSKSRETEVTPDRVQSIFNHIAPVYDNLNDRLSGGLHHIWKQMAVGWSRAQPGDRALDVCCGSGDLAFVLAEAVGKSGSVTAVDFSCQLLDAARDRAQLELPASAIDWLEGDALALPFEADCFDAATMGYGLRNLTDIPQGLRELHRVLKPGATVAILDMHRPSSPVFRAIQDWYLDALVVPAATELGVKSEYEYIAPSIDRFPTGDEQVRLAREAGFDRAVHYTTIGGMMGFLVATKRGTERE